MDAPPVWDNLGLDCDSQPYSRLVSFSKLRCFSLGSMRSLASRCHCLMHLRHHEVWLGCFHRCSHLKHSLRSLVTGSTVRVLDFSSSVVIDSSCPRPPNRWQTRAPRSTVSHVGLAGLTPLEQPAPEARAYLPLNQLAFRKLTASDTNKILAQTAPGSSVPNTVIDARFGLLHRPTKERKLL